jgi:hypothetical protein
MGCRLLTLERRKVRVRGHSSLSNRGSDPQAISQLCVRRSVTPSNRMALDSERRG